VRVKVISWSAVQEQLARLHRFALNDPELELLDVVRVWMVEE